MFGEDLRAIMVGTGGFGQVWAGLRRARLGIRAVAAVDVDPTALARAAEDLDLPSEDRFQTLSEAIGAVEADVVIDSTPPSFHRDHARIAFEHGLHVFTAKPMALAWADAVAMTQEAEAASLVLGVNEQFRFGWLTLGVQEAIQAGRLGEIQSIELHFRESSSWRGWRTLMAHPLLLDAAIQHFDMVRAATGLEAESAFCRAWRRPDSTLGGPGSAAAIFSMSGGATFTYTGTWDHPADDPDATGWWGEWRVQGSRGELRADSRRGIWINGSSAPSAIEGLDTRRLSLVVLDQFVRAVRMGSPMPTDGWSDLRTLAMCELCIRSAETGLVTAVRDLTPRMDAISENRDAPGPPVITPERT